MRFTQRERCVDQKNPSWFLFSDDQVLFGSIQCGRLRCSSRLQEMRIKVPVRKAIGMVEGAITGRGTSDETCAFWE